MEIRFHPESDEPAFVLAAAEYRRLWEAHGDEVVESFAAATGLRFGEPALDAVVFEGMSQSHPLRLRASYDHETKLATLIHELAHRLVYGHARPSLASDRSSQERQNHELIDLFLFDVWAELYGEAFAKRQVETESERRPMYREAWRDALAIDRASRTAKLRGLLQRTGEGSA